MASSSNTPAAHDTVEPRPLTVRERWQGFLREVLETVVLALFIFFVVQVVIQNYQVLGPSMEPNLHQGQYLLVNKVEYKLHQPARGDIIVFHPPDDPNGIPLIKRVIGLPGETVEIKSGQTFINGVRLEEPYVHNPATRDYSAVVPADSLIVMGDNRSNSSDSRAWGPLPINGGIVGRAVLRYWPPERVGILPAYSY